LPGSGAALDSAPPTVLPELRVDFAAYLFPLCLALAEAAESNPGSPRRMV